MARLSTASSHDCSAWGRRSPRWYDAADGERAPKMDQERALPARPVGTGRVGFIGLGQIGRPLAGRLLDCDYDLVVWNRTRERAEALAAEHTPRVTLAPSA